MKTWMKSMKSVVPLFALAIAPLARAEAPGDQALRANDQVAVGAQETGLSAPEGPQARELRETVDRLNRRISELEAQQDGRSASLGDPQDHGGWW